jgi:arylsulfatase A-like enzyme
MDSRAPVRAARIRLAGLVLLLGACGNAGGGSGTTRWPRNALLVSIDTLRPDHLSCYGNPRPTSPRLDELARAGVRFTDVTAAAPWTLPSHATMLTGLYPSHHGVKSHETRLPADVVTLAEELQARGFETLAVVNTHNLGAPQYQLGQGFARFEYITETDRDARTGRLLNPNMGEVVVSTAKELLAKRDRARPFFLFLHFYDVHTDLTPKAEYRAEFVQPYQGKLDGRTQQLNGVRKRGEHLSEADVRFLEEMYDAEIRTFDELFGRFLDWLGEQGLRDETLFLVTSDHGEEFQEHGGVLHGRTQYQELLRVPLLVAGPGVPQGLVLDDPVHGVDVTPTMLGCLGIDARTPRDGLDLGALWRGGTLPERALFGEADQDTRRAGHEQFDVKRMVRRGNDKLIHDRLARRAELFDLARDPGELFDLSSERAQRARELAAELERFLAGAIASDRVAPPSPEERAQLDALGYGGAGDGE